MGTCLERADLFAFLCVLFSCKFVTFPYGVPGQVWYLVVSIPDLYFLYGIATALINISITMMNSFHEHIPGIMVLGPCTLYLQPHNLAVWEV